MVPGRRRDATFSLMTARWRRRAEALAGRLNGPWWLLAVTGVLLVLVGGYLAVRPLASLGILLLAVSLGLVVAAAGELVDGPGEGESLPWRFVRAAAYALGGLGVVVFTGRGVRAVIVVVGVALVVAGVADLLEVRSAQGVERWNALLGGLASVAFGVLALAWPDVSVIVIGVLVGVRLILSGFRLIGRAVALVRGVEGEPRAAGGWRRWARLAGNVVALGIAVVLVLVSFTLRRGAPQPDAFYTAPASVPVQPGQLLRAEPYTREIPDGASAWRILYTTTRDEGQPAVASGLVVVPTAKARDGIPVIAWAHGTTGVAPGARRR